MRGFRLAVFHAKASDRHPGDRDAHAGDHAESTSKCTIDDDSGESRVAHVIRITFWPRSAQRYARRLYIGCPSFIGDMSRGNPIVRSVGSRRAAQQANQRKSP
ncbi:hypothetical protein Ddc_22198 [Ditylenchus destructor]|nr:hypothetical protein Ddc_22198 [Ditylenchus destructor]